MADVTTPDVANVSMQKMLDAGLNGFAVDLVIESYAKHKDPPPVTFVWRGVVVHLQAWKDETEPFGVAVLPIDAKDGGPILSDAMQKVVREASEYARGDHATPLGVGSLCALAVLAFLRGRDWKEIFLR